MKLLIANGYVIDPAQQLNAGGRSLLIEDGRVAGLLDRDEPVPEQAHVIDATGLIVAPGFIDLHTHLREPGQEYKETVESGTAAAAAGGFTAVACMANTVPPNDSVPVTQAIVRIAREEGRCRVYPIAAVGTERPSSETATMPAFFISPISASSLPWLPFVTAPIGKTFASLAI